MKCCNTKCIILYTIVLKSKKLYQDIKIIKEYIYIIYIVKDFNKIWYVLYEYVI